MQWHQIRPQLYVFHDSCTVWAQVSGSTCIIINAGTGAWIDAIDQLPVAPTAVVLTHFFRDHTAGAILAAERGIPVWAGYWEQEQLADAEGLYSRRETYIIYDNIWDLYGPIESIPITRWLQDWEEIELANMKLTVIPTPGITLGAISLATEIRDVTLRGISNGSDPAQNVDRGVFCGEVIHEPGKIYRVAPLQYNYNDLPGALRLIYSIHQIKDQEPSWLASSTGGHLITEPAPALQSLEENLIAMLRARGTPEGQIRWGQVDGINEITPHLFQSAHAEASSYFVVSRSGKVLSIDYGYRGQLGMGAGYPYPRNRRPILHGLKPLFEKTGASRIDGVLVTHFHDDHVNGIPMLQRLYGASCYAPDTFAFILANPEAYAFPCTWPEPIDVTELPADKPFTWEEYTFSFYPMSGHTRYSALVSFEVDGKRVVATGDQFFFQDQANPGRGPSAHNHVYQNGAMLNSIRKSQQQLKELDPQIILPGHGPAYEVPVELHEWTDRYAREYEDLHRSLMPLSPTDVHFEVDSRAGWLEPVRHLGTGGSPIRYTAHLRNPFPHSASLHVRLVAPEGWTTQQGAVTLPGRAEGTIELVLTPPPDATCRRTPVALELTADERPFGQVAVALVTIGYPRF